MSELSQGVQGKAYGVPIARETERHLIGRMLEIVCHEAVFA